MDKSYADLPSLLAACCRFDSSLLTKSPTALGAFLSLAKVIKNLEPEARTAAINLALKGTEIPGFILVRHETPGYVETGTLLELCLSCPLARIPALLTELVTVLGHISGAHYSTLCGIAGVNPNQTAIKRAGANPFLREQLVNPKPEREG
jgi:hypothetical protein